MKAKSLAMGMILPLAASMALSTAPTASAASPTSTSSSQSANVLSGDRPGFGDKRVVKKRFVDKKFIVVKKRFVDKKFIVVKKRIVDRRFCDPRFEKRFVCRFR